MRAWKNAAEFAHIMPHINMHAHPQAENTHAYMQHTNRADVVETRV